MGDRDLRELERRWKESGSEEDEAAYVREGLSTGALFETGFVRRAGNRSLRVDLRNRWQEVELPARIVPAFAEFLDFEFGVEGLFLLSERSVRIFGDTDYLAFVARNGDVRSGQREGFGDRWLVYANGVTAVASYAQIPGRQRVSGVPALQGGNVCCSFDYVGSEWLGAAQTADRGIMRVYHGVDLLEGRVGMQFGVHVQDGRFLVVGTDRGAEDACGLHVPKYSRFARSRFYARSVDDLERLYVVHEGRVRRVLREMPRENIEGLLRALERGGEE